MALLNKEMYIQDKKTLAKELIISQEIEEAKGEYSGVCKVIHSYTGEISIQRLAEAIVLNEVDKERNI